MATTAEDLVKGALQLLGVIDVTETPGPDETADGLRRLNAMINQWALRNGTMSVLQRNVFPLVANQTSYTIGPGGNFNMVRPASIAGAALLLDGASPQSEIWRTVYTPEGYASIPIKAMSSSMLVGIVYEPTSPLGVIRPYPVPNTTIHSLVLYARVALAEFALSGTSADLGDGLLEALEYNLARRLAAPYKVSLDPEVRLIAESSLAAIKRHNFSMMPIEVAYATGGPYYDIVTGEGG
jgi:hypothetical protein